MKKKPTKFKYHYLMRMPMTESVTSEEGGDWIAFKDFTGGLVHSIRFVGGHTWDCVNGWRNTEFSSTAGKGHTCRSSDLRDAPKSFKRVNRMPRGYPKPKKPVIRVQMGRAVV